MNKFIVLASDSNQRVQAFGPWDDEAMAGRWARSKERKYPRIQWLVLPICSKTAVDR